MPVAVVTQLVAGDFNEIFESAFFTSAGDYDVVANQATLSSTFLSISNAEDPTRITEFTGTGFSFDPNTGEPTGGTVETITFKVNATTQATITGLSISLVDLDAALEAVANGDDTLLDALFDIYNFDYSASTAPGGVIVDIDGPLDDTYVGSSSADTIIADEGNDEIEGGGGGDSILGGLGNDIIDGNGGADRIDGGAGNDDIAGGAGADSILGGAGDDLITGDGGADSINPGTNDGFDVVEASRGNDSYSLDGANATAGNYYRFDYGKLGGAVTANFGVSTGTVAKTVDGTTDSYSDLDQAIEGYEIKLGGGNDTVTADMSENAFLQIIVQGGNDQITGGEGFQRIRVQTDFSDSDTGGAVVTVTSSATDSFSMTGTLTDDFGGTVTFTDVDEIRGSNDNDTFTGASGSDQFITDEGNDSIDGGAGFDRVRYDRTGVTEVVADLEAGTVQKTWNGTTYTDQIANVEWLRGSSDGNDDLAGSDADERFQGRGGDDTLTGRGGSDDLQGEDGNDTIFGGAGDDVMDGGNGDDTLFGGDNDGFDEFLASRGNDTYDFTGADVDGDNFYRINYTPLGGGVDITIGASSATVFKNIDGSTDTLLNINDTPGDVAGGLDFRLTSANDTVTSSLAAGEFAQFLVVGGNDTITGGGAGFERLRIQTNFGDADTAGATVTVTSSTTAQGGMTGSFVDDFGGTVTFTNIDEIRGSNDDDTFFGGAGTDFFITDEGNDSIDGGAGSDRLRYDRLGAEQVTIDVIAGTVEKIWNGTTYNDQIANVETIRGTLEGADFISGSGANETFDGKGGDDSLLGLSGDDSLIGGDGNDVLLGGGGFDSISGGDGNDRLDGAEGNDTLDAGLGDDTINGGNGDDILVADLGVNTLRGQGGNDEITASDQDDELRGGIGNDTINAGDGADDVLGQGDADTINGEGGNDILRGGSGNDVVDGGADDDQIFGQGNNDILIGGAGNDTLSGAAGIDSLFGGDGDDRLFGGNAGDRLTGGAGNDLLNGGGQADRFLFDVGHDSDTITGFEDNIDTIQLTSALVGGTLTGQEVVDTFGSTVGASVLFDFGNGDTIRVNSITLAALVDDILVT